MFRGPIRLTKIPTGQATLLIRTAFTTAALLPDLPCIRVTVFGRGLLDFRVRPPLCYGPECPVRPHSGRAV